MSTFKEIQDRVLSNLIDAKTEVQNAVPTLVNQAVRDLQIDGDYECMKGVKVFTTVAGTHELGQFTAPERFKHLAPRAAWQVTLDSGTTWEATNPLEYLPSRDEALRLYRASGEDQDQGDPAFLTVADVSEVDLSLIDSTTTSAAVKAVSGQMQFDVWPAPRDADTRILIPYYAFLPALSADTDTNWFTLYGDLYLEYKATSVGFLKDWDEERSQVWDAMAQREVKKIRRLNGARITGKNRALAVRADVFASRGAFRRT